MVKPFLTAAAARQALEEQLGAVGGFRPLSEGEVSRVFGFRLDDEEFVVRVSHDISGFLKDRLAYRRFAGSGLPVPEVVAIGALDADHHYCVNRRLPGVPLSHCDSNTVEGLARPITTLLTALAAADLSGTSGFGGFDEDGFADHSAWRDFLQQPQDYPWDLLQPSLDHSVIDALLSALLRMTDACPEVRSLLHGDLGAGNLLTDGQSITGVLDWAEALFGDPLYDVANILFWRGWPTCMRRLAARLEATLATTPGVRRRLCCYQLRIGIGEAFHYAQCGSRAISDWLIHRSMSIAAEAT